MSVIIGGDVCPSKNSGILFRNGDATALLGDELLSELCGAEHVIVNLELPLCDEEHPIKKCGPAFMAPTACVKGLKAAHINAVSLANNHIMDQGEEGLRSTMEALRKGGIAYFGAGEALASARRPYFFEACGKRIGIVACTEHEFSCAEENKPGANLFDPLTLPDDVSEAKRLCDTLIVLYHGGKELYRYPSPALQKRCRRLAEKGADIVLCQHSHCIGCAEEYNGAVIVYGTGNFIFDGAVNEYTETGLLVILGDEGDIRYKPFVKSKTGVRAASPDEAADIMAAFEERSREIAAEGFVENRYRLYAAEQRRGVMTGLNGRESFVFRALNRLSGNRLRDRMLRRRYDESSLLRLYDLMVCETWSELSAAVLKEEIGSDKRK